MRKAVDIHARAKTVRENRKLKVAGRSSIPLPKMPERIKRSSTVRMQYQPGQYERIFGKTEAQRQSAFRAEIERRKKAQGREEHRSAPAIHGENKGAGRRLYGSPHKGIFDWGLGRMTYGRSDRKRAMDQVGRNSGFKAPLQEAR